MMHKHLLLISALLSFYLLLPIHLCTVIHRTLTCWKQQGGLEKRLGLEFEGLGDSSRSLDIANQKRHTPEAEGIQVVSAECDGVCK